MSIETAESPRTRPSSGRVPEARRSALADFLRGAALIFDFDGCLSRRRLSTLRHDTDADALAADWRAVGNDLRRAMDSHPTRLPVQ